jgi:hypothetical protein
MAARANDVVIVSRSMNGLSLDRDLIEAMLFMSGGRFSLFRRTGSEDLIFTIS